MQGYGEQDRLALVTELVENLVTLVEAAEDLRDRADHTILRDRAHYTKGYRPDPQLAEEIRLLRNRLREEVKRWVERQRAMRPATKNRTPAPSSPPPSSPEARPQPPEQEERSRFGLLEID